MEIYNEEIRDLLVNDPNLRHEIKMNESKDITVTNLKVEEVIVTCFNTKAPPSLLFWPKHPESCQKWGM